MPHDTLISAAELMALQAAGTPVLLLDCGFDLGNPAAGEAAWAAGHLPGAQYAHLDRDLSGHKTGRNGRHPLPALDDWAACAGRWGLTPGLQAVVYDDQGMPYAARAWWLLRWLGHRPVAVLDGGRAAWRAAGGTLVQDAPAPRPAPPYPVGTPALPTVDAAGLLALLPRLQRPVPTASAAGQPGAPVLLDARAAERFRGDVEPLDPVAGHIPGATLRCFKDNLAADGRYKPAEQLRAEFGALGAGGGSDPAAVVHQCGSGVTACHNLLAMAHAGLGLSTLYPGSWSEWCSDPARPMVRGDRG